MTSTQTEMALHADSTTDNACSVLVHDLEVPTKIGYSQGYYNVQGKASNIGVTERTHTEIHSKETTELGHPTDSSCNLLINAMESFTQTSCSYLTVSQVKVNI